MEIRDYIFIDKARLKSYFEQISSPGKLASLHRIPTWSASLSAAGPQISVGTSTVYDEPTVHKMIDVVEKYLVKEHLIRNIRNMPAFSHEPFFVLTRFQARRAFLPLKKHFALWIGQNVNHTVYLMERCTSSDNKGGMKNVSAYTALRFILSDIEKRNTQLVAKLDGEVQKQIRVDQDAMLENIFEKFRQDPLEGLERIGARIEPPRTIDALFRVRAMLGSMKDYTEIIGYPLYIIERRPVEECISSPGSDSLEMKRRPYFVTIKPRSSYRVPGLCCACGETLSLISPDYETRSKAVFIRGLRVKYVFPVCQRCVDIEAKFNDRETMDVIQVVVVLIALLPLALFLISLIRPWVTIADAFIPIVYVCSLLAVACILLSRPLAKLLSGIIQRRKLSTASREDREAFYRTQEAISVRSHGVGEVIMEFSNQEFAKAFWEENILAVTNK